MRSEKKLCECFCVVYTNIRTTMCIPLYTHIYETHTHYFSYTLDFHICIEKYN